MMRPASILLLVVLVCLVSCQNSEPDTQFQLLDKRKTGIDFANIVEETAQIHHLLWGNIYNGGGVAIGDINNDSLPDIFMTRTLGDDALFLNKGNLRFEEITATAEVQGGKTVSTGVTMADVNKDGFLDIYVCKAGWTLDPKQRLNLLFINNGDLTFTERGEEYGVADPAWSTQAAFFDFDKDGDLDLYVLNQPPSTRSEREYLSLKKEKQYAGRYNASDRLYENFGDGKFLNVSRQRGLDNFAYGLGIVTSDLNEDNYPDVFVANDFHKSDCAYINDTRGRFSNEIKRITNHVPFYSMGVDISDLNNDGYAEIMGLDMPGKDHYRSKTNMGSMSANLLNVTLEYGQHYQYMFNVLQLNNGDGTFSDIGFLAGIAKTDWSWSVLAGDYDNDGYKDIFITNGIQRDVRNNDFVEKSKTLIEQSQGKIDPLELAENAPSNPLANFMYHNNGDLTFEDVTDRWGLGTPGFSNGMAHADLDLDGDLDIVINNMGAHASVYQNHAQGNYLQFYLHDSMHDLPTEGSKVSVYTGSAVMYQELLPTRGFMSCVERTIHFGLGDVSSVDSVVVVWPNNRVTRMESPAINKRYYVDYQQATFTGDYTQPVYANALFSDITTNISYQHTEEPFNDYAKQVLLPYKYSQLGPALAEGDINGDGLRDIFVGGAAGQPGMILEQTRDGFNVSTQPAFEDNKETEDLGALLFDADGDADLDLYVATGSNEFHGGNPVMRDRFYLNNQGIFSLSDYGAVQGFTKCVVGSDIDGDGDTDLFVGGRMIAGEYPAPASSFMLRNDNGRFVDVTSSVCQTLQQIGLVTDAEFLDYDGDGDDDLLVTGEWMTPRLFSNTNGRFIDVTVPAGLDSLSGLWQSLTVGDFNGDGRPDILCGNMGTNNKFKATKKKPFEVLGNDFDKNGKYDVVLVTYFEDKPVPVRGRECSSDQLPFIAEKFPTFEEFANASIDEIIEPDLQKDAIHLKAAVLESGILMNTGGTFDFVPLPGLMQAAPVMDAVVWDFNNDGLDDIFGAGNLFQTEVETIRYDAGHGFLLQGKGDGSFDLIRGYDSGIRANMDAKNVALVRDPLGVPVVVVANNDGPLQLMRYTGQQLQ